MTTDDENTNIRISHAIVLVMIVIIGVIGSIYGPTVVKSVKDYDSDFKEVRYLLKRNDKDYFFNHTPNNKEHPIIENESELPNKPILIILYRQHCNMCEVATDSIKGYTEQLNEKYDTDILGRNIVYVNLKSPLGEQLIEEYSIERASAMLLLKNDYDQHTLLYRGETDSSGITVPAAQNITQIFEELDSELNTLKRYDSFRDQ